MAESGFALVVLPTYNERPNLQRVVEGVLRQGQEYRVLVVDDNSPDGTGRLADDLAAGCPRVAVLHRPSKQGLGSAYLAGFRRALLDGAQYVFEMDADLSHNPDDLPRLLAPVHDGRADITLGSRYTAGGGTPGRPLYRQLISRGATLYARAILGIAIHDLTDGFKCFHRRVLESLPLASVQSSGYVFQIEMTYRALRAGFRIVEVPIVFAQRAEGKSKMSSREVAEALTTVWRLRSAS
jgi:dolichol-phosphate mannosyltransferase